MRGVSWADSAAHQNFGRKKIAIETTVSDHSKKLCRPFAEALIRAFSRKQYLLLNGDVERDPGQ
jgi:hypothetical protein